MTKTVSVHGKYGMLQSTPYFFADSFKSRFYFLAYRYRLYDFNIFAVLQQPVNDTSAVGGGNCCADIVLIATA